ncbi:MAG: T9SS type A sorting domain-containing protein [Ferruginibacter sp.]
MKNFLLAIILVLAANLSIGQLTITPGTLWVNSGAAVIILNDIDLINNGTLIKGSSVVKFTGSTGNAIGGSTASSFHQLEMAKTGNNTVTLTNNIDVSKKVIFSSGLLHLNKYDLTLADTAFLENESENSRITGISGGEVIITLPLNAPAGYNPGNVGALITSTSNLGTVVIRRGHQVQAGSGMAGSIERYYDISPSNNTALDATFRFYYFDAEINGQSEILLKMFRSTNGGANWANLNYDSRNAVENFVEKTGISSFSRWTVSSSGGALPVTGLEFNARRISNDKVLLTWKTNQEFNNKGFAVERKKQTENDFSSTGFVNSTAPGGNSGFPLSYTKIDTNDFTGKTFYRLKQEDFDGKFVYSVIRLVAGSDEKMASLKVWPIPSNGNINVLFQNIEKDVLQVFDMHGRLVQQVPAVNNTTLKINGLLTGSYVIRLAAQKDLVQKIIIQ